MAGYQGQHQKSANKLGYDYSLEGQLQQAEVFKERLAAYHQKLSKIMRIPKTIRWGTFALCRHDASTDIWSRYVGNFTQSRDSFEPKM